MQSTGCTFGPLGPPLAPSVFYLRTVSEPTDMCSAWVCKLVPEVDRCECLRRPSSITGGCELGNDCFCLVFLAGTILRCILHSCSISSGSHPTFQKVSFRPSLTLPTSSSCVPGTISKISSLYSVQSPLMAGILDALASGSLLTKERQPSQGLSVLGRQEKPRLGVGLSYINQPIQSPYPGPSLPAGFYPPRSNVLVTRSCPTLCNTVDCSPRGSCVHGIPQVKNSGVGCHFLLQPGSNTILF